MDYHRDLTELRQALELTKPQMADMMGMSLRGYEELEAGRSEVKKLHYFAACFGAIELMNHDTRKAALVPRNLRDKITGAARVINEAKE